jgi:hypothetical protein
MEAPLCVECCGGLDENPARPLRQGVHPRILKAAGLTNEQKRTLIFEMCLIA